MSTPDAAPVEVEGGAVEAEPTVLVEAWSHEDGDRWYAAGHIEPARMVLACIVEVVANYGAPQIGVIQDLVIGGEWTPGHGMPEMLAHAGSLIDAVGHFWGKPDPENEEHMLPAEPGEPGASEWTELVL